MIINFNPEEWETIITDSICEFHKKHPGKLYAGCTCSTSFSLRRKKDTINPLPTHHFLTDEEYEIETTYWNRG
jgi:hypothetical protein